MKAHLLAFAASFVFSCSAYAAKPAATSPAATPIEVSGSFTYTRTMDEGTYIEFAPAMAWLRANPQLNKFGKFYVRNIDAMPKMLGLIEPEADPSSPDFCSSYTASGTMKITKLKAENEEDMDGEIITRLMADVVSVDEFRVMKHDCEGKAAKQPALKK